MPTVRTTMRPWEEITVTDSEYWNLLRQNVVEGAYGTLTVQFYMYEGGPPTDVTSVTIRITKDVDTLVATTSAGVLHTDTGEYAYAWSADDRAGAGDYLIHWEAVDESGATITAEETITLEA